MVQTLSAHCAVPTWQVWQYTHSTCLLFWLQYDSIHIGSCMFGGLDANKGTGYDVAAISDKVSHMARSQKPEPVPWQGSSKAAAQ
jgi:hypothetical protein